MKGKKIRLHLKVNGLKYEGPVTDESELFLVLIDEKTRTTRVFAKTEISSMEVIV